MKNGGKAVRIKLLVPLLLSVALAYGCASEDYNTQKGAAIGAIGGALAGQAIGHNTAGTLIGAAGGALVGAVAGNAVDQANQEKRAQAQMQAQAQPPAYTPPPPPPPPQVAAAPAPMPEEPPPGQWVDVPGEYVNGVWVPPHKAWVPANPADQVAAQAAPPPPMYAPVAAPDVQLIPGTYAYFVPGVTFDVFFYHGYWYRPFGGRWYWASAYGGPWGFLPAYRVPHVLVALPGGWRRFPPGYHPIIIHHAELQRNWARWEHERRWEGHREEHH